MNSLNFIFNIVWCKTIKNSGDAMQEFLIEEEDSDLFSFGTLKPMLVGCGIGTGPGAGSLSGVEPHAHYLPVVYDGYSSLIPDWCFNQYSAPLFLEILNEDWQKGEWEDSAIPELVLSKKYLLKKCLSKLFGWIKGVSSEKP